MLEKTAILHVGRKRQKGPQGSSSSPCSVQKASHLQYRRFLGRIFPVMDVSSPVFVLVEDKFTKTGRVPPED